MVRNAAAARSTWDVRLDSLAADAMMPLGQINRRQSERERAELVSQIADLKATVEAQGELLRRMVEMLDGKGKQKAVQFEEERSGPWS
jgi:potassium voltage-gated channel Shal-related subfamily D member 2